MQRQSLLTMCPNPIDDPAPYRQPAPERLRRFLPSALLLIVAAAFMGCKQHPLPPRPYVAFVACEGSSSVAVVNLATLKTIKSISIDGPPIRVLARPDSHQIFVISSDGKVSTIDFPSLTVQRVFSAGKSARDPWFSPDGNRLYVLDAVAGEIVAIDAQKGEVVESIKLATGLANLALTPNGKTLVVSDEGGNRLFFADAQSDKVLGSVAVGKDPGPLAILPDGSKVFVADTLDDKVSSVDISSRSLVDNIEIGSQPDRLALKPDGGELFAFSENPPTMTIIDTSQDEVEQNLPTGKGVLGTVFRRDSSMLYMGTSGNGFVSFFDVGNRTVTSAINVSDSPGALALTPDQRFLAVAGANSASLIFLETEPPSLISLVPVGSDPVDIIIPGWLLNGGR